MIMVVIVVVIVGLPIFADMLRCCDAVENVVVRHR